MVRYGKLLLDTERSLSLPRSASTCFSLPRSPNQANGRHEGMEVIEPDGETSGGPSTRSHEPLAENNGYVQIKSGTISVIPLNFQKKKKKSHFALRFHLLLRDLLESFSLLLLLRDFRRPLKRRSRPVIKKLQEQVPRLSRLSRQIFKMCDSRQETLAFKPGKRRDRDPAPEVGEFLFGLSGCRGFARRGRDPVSGVVGR